MKAVIDIGSNSVRLMLYTGKPVTPKKVATTALAEGLAKTGELSKAAMERTKSAVADFVLLAKSENAQSIDIFATEAVRSAKNGIDFCQELYDATGIKVDIISGEMEARLCHLGAVAALSPVSEITVIDVGGASVEVVRGDSHRLTYARSLPLGVRRLLDNAGTDRKAIENYCLDKISGFGIVSGFEGVAVGGTATSLASMHLGQTQYDPYKVHGTVLSLRDMDALIDEIFSGVNLAVRFPTLPEKRRSVIGHGAIILRALTEYLGLDEITVSESDNLEGYLLASSSVSNF
jgi:exopolyphosphatase/guanosine-5'-triphosphate,3'-diphosphate pyrophosphatase